MSEHQPWHSRGYLPHYDDEQLLQSITFRLADSLLQSALQIKWESLSQQQKLASQLKLEELLDRGQGSCVLRRSDCAEIVQEQLLAHDALMYRLLAWVIMPNHVHVLIESTPGYSLSKVLQQWKGASSFRIHRLLGKSGRLWQPEYFDRYIRDEEHLVNTVNYIEFNPVRAGLVVSAGKWRFSSASYRSQIAA